ncbi:ribonuclease H-like domain-containing protein [Melanogaster broomeanus]|nr:ribonuclease H-like domain-containing protein [Melanogaster broomeanus]
MSNRGRGFDRGRGRGDFRGGAGGGGGGRGSPDSFRGRGGPPPPFRGGDRGGRGSFDRGGPRGRGGPPRARGGVFMRGQRADIDPRIADNSDKALVASFQAPRARTDRDSMPFRPDFGTDGREIKLRTNFFPVKVPKGPLYEYDVAITPVAGTAIRRVKRRIYQLAEQTSAWQQAGMVGRVAHDSSAKLIAAHILPQPLTIRVPFYDEEETAPPQTGGKEYTLTVKFIQEINTGSLMSYLEGQPQYRNYDILPIISALNIILAATPGRTGIMVGRNRYFFRSAAQPYKLGGGLEAWKGFYSSVRPAHKQLMINVNVCTTAFYTPGNLADAMMAFRDLSFGARMDAFCRGVRVKTRHLGYRKTVKKLAHHTAKSYSFDTPEYKRITVQDYFKRKYNIDLRYPDLPLVDVGGQKTNYLPAEVCDILPDQPFRGKLTDEHTASMITVACQPPNVNGEAIVNQGLDNLGLRTAGPELQSFGVSIGPNMAVVPGRILPRPGVRYSSTNASIDDRASWNLRGVKFAVGARLDRWAVLVIKDGVPRDEFASAQDQELFNVVDGLRSMCNTSGMHVASNPSYAEAQLPRKNPSDPMRRSAIEAIRAALLKVKPKPDLILIMLVNGDKAVYEGLKHLCDVFLDVATIRKSSPQYFANVALKINMKMGGVNHKLDPNSGKWLAAAPTMVVGMDVTHPSPGSAKGTPSIAAVVASIDNHYAQYPASLEIQETKKEMITNLKVMMVDRIKLFQRKNKETLPERVLVYRDGVSEGQFDIAFRSFSTPKGPYRPKLTIIICGKRHHTRFYPTEEDTAAGDGNPRAGTVVDRGVTAVYDFDFFLQAHGGLQGTTRPTHYYVVHDEIGFKANELQGLTNSLSYILVSPAYYADVACERGRCYLRKLIHGYVGNGTTTSGSTAEEEVMNEAKRLWNNGVTKKNLKDTMFYL